MMPRPKTPKNVNDTQVQWVRVIGSLWNAQARIIVIMPKIDEVTEACSLCGHNPARLTQPSTSMQTAKPAAKATVRVISMLSASLPVATAAWPKPEVAENPTAVVTAQISAFLCCLVHVSGLLSCKNFLRTLSFYKYSIHLFISIRRFWSIIG